MFNVITESFRETIDRLFLPSNPLFCHEKKNLCFFSYLKFKFNKALYEKDKITNLYRQQNIRIQKSIIKVLLVTKKIFCDDTLNST